MAENNFLNLYNTTAENTQAYITDGGSKDHPWVSTVKGTSDVYYNN